MQPDWKNALPEERKALYRAVRLLMDEHRWPLAFVLDAACGVRHVGAGYEDNFRAGKISRKRAQQIYDWLRATHPAYADKVEAEIVAIYGSDGAAATWETFIAQHGVFDGLVLEEARRLRSAVVRVRTDRPEPVQATVRVTHPFVLVAEPDSSGRAVALQWMRGTWLLLPLETSAMATTLSNLVQRLPKLSPGDPKPFWYEPHFREDAETGLWRFVLIIADAAVIEGVESQLGPEKAVAPSTLDRIAARLVQEPQTSWSMKRFNVMFVAEGL